MQESCPFCHTCFFLKSSERVLMYRGRVQPYSYAEYEGRRTEDCIVCMEPPKEPVSCPVCGHVLCRTCYYCLSESPSGHKCPNCRSLHSFRSHTPTLLSDEQDTYVSDSGSDDGTGSLFSSLLRLEETIPPADSGRTPRAPLVVFVEFPAVV